ncbi:MAG: Gx transporter family protein [Lachnospiraceae bacterium]|nr:Gx transporter family protein [Lachnospiraceae bacterium]
MSRDHASNQRGNNNHATALSGVLMALALVLSYLETLVPIHFVVPGVKLGLANIVTIIALVRLGIGRAIIISVGRILLSGVLFGNPLVIVYSLAGAALSMLVMVVMRKFSIFSVTGVSVGGAIAHNFGQLLVAALIMENVKLMYYMAILSVTGVIAGCAIGLLTSYLLKILRF